ncbi:hypothetical protein [Chryseobacterium sp.]
MKKYYMTIDGNMKKKVTCEEERTLNDFVLKYLLNSNFRKLHKLSTFFCG